MLEVNASKTDDCVNFIRQAGRKVHYLYRGCNLKGRHPLTDTAIRILAPEEDSAVYYQSVPHFALNTNDIALTRAPGRPLPLPGIDGGAFYELIERMDSAFSEGIFAIDQAANNTSLVFELTWRQRRFLFPGDAELKSWQKMAENTRLQPVDLFKIGHHGSRNGTPPPPILDKILPPERRKQTVAVLSTYPAVLSKEPCVYSGVPDPPTLVTIKARTRKVYSTTDVPAGKPIVVTFDARG